MAHEQRMDHAGHSTVSMQLHYTHIGRDRLREISQVDDPDVGETLGATSFALGPRKMEAIRDFGVRKVVSADRGKGGLTRYFVSSKGG